MPNNRKLVKSTLIKCDSILNDYARLQFLWSVPDSSQVTDTMLEKARQRIQYTYRNAKWKTSYEEIAYALATKGLDVSEDELLDFIDAQNYHGGS